MDNQNKDHLSPDSKPDMSSKLNILVLPDGRKEPENGYLSQLVHLLHEHTIDSLLGEPPTQFNIEKFFSSTSIERRSSTTRILRKIVEDSATDKKQLEVLSELESLRSTIENLHKESIVPQMGVFIESLDVTLKKLVSLIQPKESKSSWFNRVPRLSFIDLNAFEQLGGLFVMLDILFLDRQMRTLGPEFVKISDTKFSRSVKLNALWIVSKVLDHQEDAKTMFCESQTLLSYLADTYRASCYKEGEPIRTRIASIFRSLLEPYKISSSVNYWDFRTCGIVPSLAETALQCHADKKRTDELISTLGALVAMARRNNQCREDLLAVEGSMDMVIDLFGDRRESDRDYPFGHKGNRYDWLWDHVPDKTFAMKCFLALVVILYALVLLDFLYSVFWLCFPPQLPNTSYYCNDKFCFNHGYNTSGQFDTSALCDSFNISEANNDFSSAHSDLDQVNVVILILMIITTVSLLITLMYILCLSRLHRTSKQLLLAASILNCFTWGLHRNARALERFRSRDVCALLILYLDVRPFHDERYFRTINIIGNMIDYAMQMDPTVDNEPEKKRLIELGIRTRIRRALDDFKKLYCRNEFLEFLNQRQYFENFVKFFETD